MPGEVLKISKRYSQPNLSYWRKTNRGPFGAPLIRSRVKTCILDNYMPYIKNGLANNRYVRTVVARQYKAASQDDLWSFLTEQAHRDRTLTADITVKQVMDTWTLQMGFPVVEVRRDYAGRSAQLTQVRALPSKKH